MCMEKLFEEVFYEQIGKFSEKIQLPKLCSSRKGSSI